MQLALAFGRVPNATRSCAGACPRCKSVYTARVTAKKKGLIAALERLLAGEETAPLPARGPERLALSVAEHMPAADADTHRIVTAVAGLLACVAYADQQLAPSEAERVLDELRRIHGLPTDGAEAIARVLREEIAAVTATGDHAWVRDLRELADRDMRVELLGVLVDLAAADDELSLVEVNYLRRLTTALGLEQSDYDAAQSLHRDKLSTLR